MKKLKLVLVSFAVGLFLSVPTVAVLACDPNCAPSVVVNGKVCPLVGGDCNAECTVCACGYDCRGDLEIQ